jgi:hypothetical protein
LELLAVVSGSISFQHLLPLLLENSKFLRVEALEVN